MTTSWSTVDVLVLAAHPPDLRGLRPLLGDQLAGWVRNLRVTAKACGLGLAAAGASASKRIFQLQPRAVVFVGTAGVYPNLPGYHPHDVVVAERARLIDLGEMTGLSAFPAPVLTEIAMDNVLGPALLRFTHTGRSAPVGCPLAATRSDELAAHVPTRCGCQLENLELFSVAHACQLGQVPLAAVLGVSHVCGSTAAADWPKFERQSAIAAAESVGRWLDAGAPALAERSARGA